MERNRQYCTMAPLHLELTTHSPGTSLWLIVRGRVRLKRSASLLENWNPSVNTDGVYTSGSEEVAAASQTITPALMARVVAWIAAASGQSNGSGTVAPTTDAKGWRCGKSVGQLK
jgi:hypothetical protein